MILVLFGQPHSGKTTLATEIYEKHMFIDFHIIKIKNYIDEDFSEG